MSLIPKNDSNELAPTGGGIIPPIDVYEKDGKVIVETALAGVDPKDVEVTVADGMLTIKGKTEHSTEVDEKNYYFKEMRYGAFMRKVALPVGVIAEDAQTTSEHGLLKIEMKKK